MTDGSREAQTRHRLSGEQEPAPAADKLGSPTAPDDASREQLVAAVPAPEPAQTPADGSNDPGEAAGPTDADARPDPRSSWPDDRLQSKVSPGFAGGGFEQQSVGPEVEPAAAPPATPPPASPDAEDAAPSPAADDELEPEDEVLTIRDRLRRLSPALVTLTVASVGSALFLVVALTSHTTPVAVLMSAGVVTALVFALDTVICSAATYRFSGTEEFGSALATALLGGISAVICAVAMAATLIMILVLNS